MQVRNPSLILNSIFRLLPISGLVVEDVTRTKSRSRFKKPATMGSADNLSNLLKDNTVEAKIKWAMVEFVSSISSPKILRLKHAYLFSEMILKHNYR